MADIVVRRGLQSDLEAVFGLSTQLVTGPQGPQLDDFVTVFNNVVRWRENETNVLYVAEEDEVVIGYTLMTVSRLLHTPGLTAQIQELVVDESARGRGVGSALVRTNESYAQQRGIRRITMGTARLGGFYRRLGYQVTAEFYSKQLPIG
ncbi:GNAT family N-acetyltransferase [Mycetocola reblochoni]|uniref:Acetyltransferase n=1 Tax=Mycetocola reblochoni REB411 TaxID=1255698 RepID=A0A1R4J6Z9_9MICO|nr:GNAT family N-acetyltransferase [Mycetocola reblochoni]SJN27585.1 Acetyltransferase [Mycetocola reblochoni REB411]